MLVERAKSRIARFLPVALLSVFSLWPLAVAIGCRDALNDDSYITLTYAKNLAHGNGFVYNHPPATLGTTTPLFALSVGALARVLPWADVSHLAVYLNALCWAGTAWLVYFSRRDFACSRWEALLVAVVILISGWLHLGSELYLFQFLFFLTAILFLRGRFLAAGVCGGLLFLTRGEGCLLMPLLMGIRLLESRPRNGAMLRPVVRDGAWLTTGFLVVFALWCAYAWPTFGRILPDTLSAKMIQGQTSHKEVFGPACLWRWAWNSWWSRPRPAFLRYAYWGLLAVGMAYAVWNRSRWLLLLAWGAAYVAGYTLLRVGAYAWYQYPPYMVWIIFVALGTAGTIRCLLSVKGRARIPAIMAAGLLVAVVVGLQFHPRSVLGYTGDPRAPLYHDLCRWLRENTDPSDSVAYAEVGYLGFYTDNPIIDLLGLTTPDILPYLRDDDYLGGFWRHGPEYYIHNEHFPWFQPLVETERFKKEYRFVATVGQEPATEEVLVFKRNVDNGHPSEQAEAL